MFFFAGLFPRERQIAAATLRCEHCHEVAQQRFLEAGSRLWVFFIPLFTFGRTYVMVCTNCSWATELSRDAAMRAAAVTGAR